MRIFPSFIGCVGLSLAVSPALFAEEADGIAALTPDIYHGGRYYQEAQAHPKLKKVRDPKRRVRLVARDLGWKSKRLQSAIEKFEAAGPDISARAAERIRAKLAATPVKGQILDVLINDSEPKHVVAYVRWQASSGRMATQEASHIAHATAHGAPFVSTLSLSAIAPGVDRASKTSVWAAKISRSAMLRINPKRIPNFADRSYKRLFEDLKTKPF